jgi:hypothetical protein
MTVTALACFQHVQWRPDNRELRRFAIAMLVGFLGLGLIAAWRSSSVGRGTLALWGLGLLLAVAALIPGLGRAAYLSIYIPTSLVGYVVSKVILVLIFSLVFVPLALILRSTGKDLLRLHPKQNRAVWTPLKREHDSDRYYHQF